MAQTGVSKSGRPDDAAGQPPRGRELPDALVPDQRSVPAAEFLSQVADELLPAGRRAATRRAVYAGHRDARTTRRYDRAREDLDRSPTYALSRWLADRPQT